MSEKGKGVSSTPSLNITESKQAEEELARLSEAVRMSADSIVISDMEGKITYVNEATLKMYGTDDPKDLLGKSSFELIAPEDREKAFAGMKEVMERGYAKDREYQVTTKSGSKILTEMSTSLVKSKTGEAIGFVSISRDITERKRAEQDLNERVKELQCLYGIARIDERLGIISDELYQEIANLLPASWQYPEITCARITINGKKFETENHKETKWKQSSDIKVYGAKAGQVEVSYLEERPEIDEGPFSKEERLLIDAVAKQLGNITERKQAEAKLRESDERYRAIFESTSDMLVLIDRKGKILDVNENIAQISEYEREEIVGKNIRALTKMMTKKSLAIIAKNFLKRMAGMNIPPLRDSNDQEKWRVEKR